MELNVKNYVALVENLTREERVTLADRLLGKFVYATILTKGDFELVGFGREYDTDCCMFNLLYNDELIAETGSWQDVFTDCHLVKPELDEMYDVLFYKGYDWQQCVVDSQRKEL